MRDLNREVRDVSQIQSEMLTYAQEINIEVQVKLH